MSGRPKVGFLPSAMLEDEYNKTAHVRPEAQKAAGQLKAILDEKLGADIVYWGLVEDETMAEQAAQLFKREDVSLIISTYLAYTPGIVQTRALLQMNVPVVIWNTQLSRGLKPGDDFDIVMVNSGSAGIPELTNALLRAGKQFSCITGHALDEAVLAELADYCAAARAVRRLRQARIGLIGHTYQGMTDLMIDAYALRHKIGPLIWQVELEELGAATAAVPETEAKALAEELGSLWDISGVEEERFLRSMKLILAYQTLIKKHNLDAVCSFDQGLLSDPRIGTPPPLATSYLTSKGIPFTCEVDIPTAVAMLILQELAGSATFLEYLVIDFDTNSVLLNHDGHGNMGLATSPKDVKIKPSIYYKGVHGYSAAGEYAYKPGDVTMAGLVSVGSKGWRLVTGEGESLPWEPRPIVAPQMLFRPKEGRVEAFIDRWCIGGGGHHQAVAYGLLNSKVAKVAELLGIEVAIV